MENLIRQEEILAYLKAKHFASIAELAEAQYTSQSTVRRDVEKLEAKGAVKSVYGGVVITGYENSPVPVYIREKENSSAKEKIAKKAAELVNDNSTIILDSSTTVRRMCKYIKNRQGLTVITNSLCVCNELKDSDVTVLCTGGEFIKTRECFVGHIAEDFLRNIKADMLFFSSQGYSSNGDITDSSSTEVSLRRAMMFCSVKRYFLCDASKKDKDYTYKLCNVSDINKAIFG